MPPDQSQNINLLPGDLKRKREVIKKVIADDVVSYSQPQNGKKETAPEKKSLISFWGRKGGNVFKTSPGGSLRLSGEKFNPSAKSTNGVGAIVPPKPDFLNKKNEPRKEIKEIKLPGEKKPSWWQRLFIKKEKPAKIEPIPAPKEPSQPQPKREEPKREEPKKEEPKAEELKKEEKKEKPKKEPIPEPPKELPKVELPKTETPKPEPIEKAETPDGPVNGKTNGFVPPESPRAGNEFDVNLLSKEYAEVFKVKNQKSVLITWSVVAVAIVIFAYLGVHLYQLQKSASIRKASQLNSELEKTIATYSDLEQEDALLLQKISSLKTLLGRHISLNRFLGLLEAATTPEVTYTAIAASREGLVTITALATDYTSLARQLSILQEHTDWIQEAQVTSAQLSKDNQAKTRGVEFDLLLKVDKSVFSESDKTAP